MKYVVKPFRAVIFMLTADGANKRRYFYDRYVVHALACFLRIMSMQCFSSPSSRTDNGGLIDPRFARTSLHQGLLNSLPSSRAIVVYTNLRLSAASAVDMVREWEHAKAWTTNLFSFQKYLRLSAPSAVDMIRGWEHAKAWTTCGGAV